MDKLNKHYQISELIAAYLADEDRVLPAELAEWLAESSANRAIFEQLVEGGGLTASMIRYQEIDVDKSWGRVSRQLPLPETGIRKRLWPRMLVAAAAVAVIVFGLWFVSQRTGIGNGMAYKNDIAPGRNTATLTLADGRVVTLSDAKNGVIVTENALTYNDSSSVISNAERNLLNSKDKRSLGALEMTLTTPRGGTYQITLTDGTKVWLNAASSLTYSAGLSKKGQPGARVVKLEGEAYFEVAKLLSSGTGQRPERVPFIVESAGQRVEVLGTHFNVNAYVDESSIKTTLIEGSVRVSGKNKQVVLQPHQQAMFDNDIRVKEVDVDNETAWKNGDFVFDSDDLESIMRKISRWYNVEVVYKEKPDKKMHFGGFVSRAKNISAVLKIMQSTGQVSFDVQGRRITVIQN